MPIFCVSPYTVVPGFIRAGKHTELRKTVANVFGNEINFGSKDRKIFFPFRMFNYARAQLL